MAFRHWQKSKVLSFSYDAAGNLTGDGQASWAYNDRGRLASVTRGGHTVSYSYDGLGQRVSKQGPASVVPTGARYFMYDEAGKLLGEYDASGQALREYVYLGDMPLAILQGTAATPTVYYVYADQVNRPWVITNVWDQERWRWDTSPFGELAPDENPSGLGNFAMPLRYPGQYADVESGLHYNYFRDYDPQTGRYAQSDPIGVAGGINTYSYVRGNPATWVDPLGLVNLSIPGATGQNSVHANPGPEATTYRPEHHPAHVHLGKNDGPRVDIETFAPLTDEDARRMTRAQKKFCAELTEDQKSLIKKRQGQVFKYGKVLTGILTGPQMLSITAACQQDPMWCLEQIEAGVLP